MRLNLILAAAGLLLACLSCGDGAASSQTTNNGNPYTLFANGTGELAQIGDKVTYHEDMYKNDTLLRSSRDSKAREFVLRDTASMGSNVPASIEALYMMRVGDSIVIAQSFDKLPKLPRGVLKTDKFQHRIKILSIKTKGEVEKEASIAKAREGEVTNATLQVIKDYQAGTLGDKIKTTPSGLKYFVHEPGTGVQAEAGKKVSVQYSGFLLNGTNFDNSFKRGQSFDFELGKGMVIKGWDEGIALLKTGAKATLFIPSELGYGEKGAGANIPPNSELVFYVELEGVN